MGHSSDELKISARGWVRRYVCMVLRPASPCYRDTRSGGGGGGFGMHVVSRVVAVSPARADRDGLVCEGERDRYRYNFRSLGRFLFISRSKQLQGNTQRRAPRGRRSRRSKAAKDRRREVPQR